VKPGADFYDIENVIVIKRLMTKPVNMETADGKEKDL
jgi:rod shape-determining protein MreC